MTMTPLQSRMLLRRYTNEELDRNNILNACVIEEQERLDDAEHEHKTRRSLYQDTDTSARSFATDDDYFHCHMLTDIRRDFEPVRIERESLESAWVKFSEQALADTKRHWYNRKKTSNRVSERLTNAQKHSFEDVVDMVDQAQNEWKQSHGMVSNSSQNNIIWCQQLTGSSRFTPIPTKSATHLMRTSPSSAFFRRRACMRRCFVAL